MQRVMIVGQPGSGKSTLARALGTVTGLPVHHVDRIHWMPGWEPRPRSERADLCHAVETGERWVFEGGFSSSWPHRLDRADTLIWLDVPLSIRAFRVVRRTLRSYGRTRPDMQEACPERFNAEFYRWIWSTRKTGRESMRRLYDSAPPGKRRYRLTTLAEVDALLASVGREGAT